MSPYMQLKSPFRSPSIDLGQGLDRKAEYMDKDGVLRRSSSVTRRMIQRGASITDAGDVMPDEQLHTSVNTRSVEKHASRKASIQLGEEATRKAAANAVLKYQAKIDKEEGLKKANQRVAERVRRYEELHLSLESLGDVVDVTENSTAMSPSKTNTYIDEEGNLRRRIFVPTELNSTQDGFIPGPATPPLPDLSQVDEPQEYF
ncbi:hypothetical protein L917_10225 [Phytophthora nicotianae]|uniref:Uncharacterized protein n=4 Tax=Phytophthora nicotianae TaxID=4792 RepID=W2RBN4_PHYN3|nr:hypothetical protein PPTG_02023 [Phytophthora nicotianae INRA-310]ETL91210.1 hypothetical protein L917_10225 [Phytophthora nicotianae]ETN21955.1 hypothetical protein PPTG_02023 [Phytophthora nicotianae INRA-310]ETO73289.1 hypothetical protein F444_10731 [Phytophthora nicotianae P1976]